MKTDSRDYTYRRIRRSIGYIGIGLPIVLICISLVPFFKTSIQSSISHYYYTNLREIFTGGLCAVSLFLIRYRGHHNVVFWKNDSLLTNIAGYMALGVAFIPTNPDFASQKMYTIIPYSWYWLGVVHYVFAGVLFLILSLLAICVFTIGQDRDDDVEKSVFDENNIYRFCGFSILLFILLIPIASHFKLFSNSTFILEALSLFSFGIAWLVKGRALGDKGIIGKKLYREINAEHSEVSPFRKWR